MFLIKIRIKLRSPAKTGGGVRLCVTLPNLPDISTEAKEIFIRLFNYFHKEDLITIDKKKDGTITVLAEISF